MWGRHLEKMRCRKQPEALEKAASCSGPPEPFQADPHNLPRSPGSPSNQRGGIKRASFLSPALQPGAPLALGEAGMYREWASFSPGPQAAGTFQPALSRKSGCRAKNRSFL